MADKTEIAWTDSTFNPWIGCTKVGPGCDNCYAEREFDHRHHKAKWGAGQERVRTSVHNWNQPKRWNAKQFMECTACGWRGELAAELCGCGSCGSIHHLNHARRRVFCASLADVFDNEVPAQWRADLFRLIADTPNLDWLVLTKRIGNAQKMIEQAMFDLNASDSERLWFWGNEPWPNVWLGATICNQTEADRDIPKLLAVPAAVRFISMEPMMGPVELDNICTRLGAGSADYIDALHCDESKEDIDPDQAFGTNTLDWVIVGGESGPKARPVHPDWVRSIRNQCAAAGTSFLFKQWGEWIPEYAAGELAAATHRFHSGAKFHRFDDGQPVMCVGKKAAGRLLDGKMHNEFPEVAP